jgi:hypothetical protein
MARNIFTAILLFVLFVACERDYEPTPVDTCGVDISDAKWVKTFSTVKATYYVFFSSPALEEGTNSLRAKIYLENMKPVTGFRIEIDPRMPDMGNHSSPNNKPLEWNAEQNIYEGAVNLTMTGWWRLYLTVLNAAGELITSEEIYWDVYI